MDAMNRRIERFKSKVQININLADDEIERLSQDLIYLQGEVDSVKDQISRVNIQLDQSEQKEVGIQNREKAKSKSKISRQKTKNETEINELVKKHKKEIANIQKDYQETLKKLNEIAESKEASRLAPLESQLKFISKKKREYESTIRSSNSSVVEVANSDFDAIKSIETSRIKSLQNTILKKNAERLRLLKDAKQRLTECVETLDRHENDHNSRMNSLQLKLKNLDNSYEQKEKMIVEKNQREITKLKNNYKNMRKQEEEMKDSIDKVERNQKRQMMAAIMEGEDLKHAIEKYNSRSSCSHSNSMSLNEYRSSSMNASESGSFSKSFSEEKTDPRKLKHNYAKLRNMLEKKENELIKTRTENETLKREIARVKHELGSKKKKSKSSFD